MFLPLCCVKKIGQEAPYFYFHPFNLCAISKYLYPFDQCAIFKVLISDHCVSVENPPLMLFIEAIWKLKRFGKFPLTVFPNEILIFRSLFVRGKSPLDVVAVIFCKESRSRGFGQQAFGSKPHSLLYSLLHIVLISGHFV